MKLITPYFEIFVQDPFLGTDEMFKTIEKAGRTCYKSENKITETSAKEFVNRIISSGHLSVLEHGTAYLRIPGNDVIDKQNIQAIIESPYSSVKYYTECNEFYVATNYRVIKEHNVSNEYVESHWCYNSKHFELRVMIKWYCSRVIADEFFRHRIFSRLTDMPDVERFGYSQESSRYCNYSKDKFNGEITYIIPRQFADVITEGDYGVDEIGELADKYGSCAETTFLYALLDAESAYLALTEKDGVKDHNGNIVKAQVARDVLPLSYKGELVMTGFISDWVTFFSMRTDNAAHPDAKYLADNASWEFFKLGLWDEHPNLNLIRKPSDKQ